MTSWDRQSYRTEWYDRRRKVKIRRRYVRDGAEIWNAQSRGLNLDQYQGIRNTQSLFRKERERWNVQKQTGGKERRTARTNVRYSTYPNPEDRRRAKEIHPIRQESRFQSRLRKQTGLEREIEGRSKGSTRRRMRTKQKKRNRKTNRVWVWTSWFGRLRWIEKEQRDAQVKRENQTREKDRKVWTRIHRVG